MRVAESNTLQQSRLSACGSVNLMHCMNSIYLYMGLCPRYNKTLKCMALTLPQALNLLHPKTCSSAVAATCWIQQLAYPNKLLDSGCPL